MAKIYGALEVAQLEWFTQSPDTRPSAASNTYRVIYASDVKQIQISDGTSWRVSNITIYTAGTLPAAGATNQYQIAFITDTLQVKVSNGSTWTTIGARLDTYTSGTIPAAASNTNQMIWVSDLQQVQVSNGTAWIAVGATSGLKNYFSQNNANPNFETNSVSPWSACTLTFSSGVPSGAPTLTATQMSIATTATTPLAGTYSMQLTKAAANAQYQGFISGALTIDREDTAKVLYGSFSYEVVSGTVDFSGTSTQTYEIWIYNTVSGAWTQPAGYRGMNQSSGQGKVTFSFQTDGSASNNSYRIAVITQQTGTGNIVVEFDSFQLGPSAIILGAAMTDWQSYTPTFTNLGTPVTGIDFKWRRVGNILEIIGYGKSATVASNQRFTLPAGLNIDTSVAGVSATNTLGFFNRLPAAAGSAITTGGLFYDSALGTQVLRLQTRSDTGLYETTATAAISNNEGFSCRAFVPIQGWSSTVQMSNDTDTRVVDFLGSVGSGQVLTANITNVSATTTKDSHGAWTGSTYVVPVSGDYIVSGHLGTNASNQTPVVYLNGIVTSPALTWSYSSGSNFSSSGCVLVPNLKAGDVLSLRSTSNGTVNTANICIFRLSGPSAIAASETVAAKYSGAISATVSTTAPFQWNTKQFDTHNAVTTGASWRFTAPISGTYRVSAACAITASIQDVAVYKNGSLTPSTLFAANPTYSLSGSTSIQLLAGEFIDVRPQTGSFTAVAGTNYNISIERIGN